MHQHPYQLSQWMGVMLNRAAFYTCSTIVRFVGGGPEADRLLPPDGPAVPDQLCDGEPPRHTSIQS